MSQHSAPVPLVVAGLLVAGLVAIHSFWLNDQPVNYADSNDILLAVSNISLAHPPGYPLLVCLIAGLHQVLPRVPLVLLANMTSVVLMSVSTGLVFLLLVAGIRRWLDPSFHEYAYPLAIALWWQLIPLNWSLSTVVEVMPLAICLIVGFLLAGVTDRWFLAGFLGMMAGLYHPLLFGVVILVWIFVIQQNRVKPGFWIRILGGSAAAIGITVAGYALLAGHQSTYGWELPHVWWQWLQWWTRAVYTSTGSAIEQFNQGFQIVPVIDALRRWSRWWLVDQWGWWGLIGLVVAFTWLWRRRYWHAMVWLGLPVVVYGFGLAAYVKHPSSFALGETALWWGIALRERMFYVLPLAFLPGMAIGSWLLATWTNTWRRGKRVPLCLLIIFCAGAVSVQSGISNVDRGANAAAVYALQLLKSLPSASVLIVDSDEVFNLLYAQQILKVRNDISIVPAGMVLQPERWRQEEKEVSLYGFSEDTKRFVADVIQTSLAHDRPVYVYNLTPETLIYLGLEGNPFYAMPYGWTLQVSTRPIVSMQSYDYGLTVQLAAIKTEQADNWFKGFRTHLATIHAQQAYYLSRLGLAEQAAWHQSMAKQLFYEPQSRESVDVSVQTGKTQFETQQSYVVYTPLSASAWADKATPYIINRDWQPAAYYLSRALLLKSTNQNWRQELILVYQQAGETKEAAAESELLR